jgi:hypothetical protein
MSASTASQCAAVSLPSDVSAPAPSTPRSPDRPPVHDDCQHPLHCQSVTSLDSIYARTCQCGVVLDTWRHEAGRSAGLESLATQRGTTINAIRARLSVED